MKSLTRWKPDGSRVAIMLRINVPLVAIFLLKFIQRGQAAREHIRSGVVWTGWGNGLDTRSIDSGQYG